MSLAAIVPRDIVDRKPKHGQACNRCGACCIASLCPLAQHVFQRGVPGPCPALSFDDSKQAICGLVAEPMKHARLVALRAGVQPASEAAALLIGSGTGCDARINGEPHDEAFYNSLLEWDRRTKSQTRRAKKIWSVS